MEIEPELVRPFVCLPSFLNIRVSTCIYACAHYPTGMRQREIRQHFVVFSRCSPLPRHQPEKISQAKKIVHSTWSLRIILVISTWCGGCELEPWLISKHSALSFRMQQRNQSMSHMAIPPCFLHHVLFTPARRLTLSKVSAHIQFVIAGTAYLRF
jgi:hypothetical protein